MRQYLLFAFLCITTNNLAYNFSLKNSAGKVIYYVFSSNENEVAVCRSNIPGNTYNYYCHDYVGEIEIPEKVVYNEKTYEVTSISSEAFKNCDDLTSINIPNSVTTIGNNAFYDCDALTSINIPNSVTTIGSAVFKNCPNLSSVTISNGVISIGSSAFEGCKKLSSIIIPNSVTTIGSSAFVGCVNLESVVIGVGVVTIGERAFEGHVPAKVCWLPSVPPNGYDNAGGRINYVVNDKYDKLSDKIIYTALNSMFEVNGVICVPISFLDRTCDIIDCSYDTKVTTLVINKSIKYKEVDMNVVNVQPYAFYSNQYIKNVTFDLEGKVPNYAFQDCMNLESAKLGDMVTCIGESSFEKCTNLSSLSMGNGLKEIKTSAFKNCQLLKDLKLGQNLEIIGKNSFSNCKSISEIKCFQQLVEIMDYAFSGCSNLKKITIEENNMESGCRRQILNDWSAGHYRPNHKNFNFEVKAGDKMVFDYYADCHYGSYFYIRLNGEEIIHEDGNIKSCYVHTFTKDQNVTLEIGLNLYYDSDGWTSAKVYNIEIGNNCRLSLGSNGNSPLFSDCKLDEVYIGRKIVFFASSDDGYSPFALTTSLKSAVISNKETVLPNNIFYGCTNLSNVILDDNTEIIGNLSLCGCSSIKNFVIGPKVTEIGEEAFSGCAALTKLVCLAENAPVCRTSALDGINKFNCTLYVPETSINYYKAAEQWKDFWYIQGYDPTNINMNTIVPCQQFYYYDLNGSRLLRPTKGINILKYDNGKTKKILVK